MSFSEDFDLENYEYELDPARIASWPTPDRSQSRLLILDRQGGELQEDRFENIDQYLEPGSLLVVNTSKVLPARLMGRKESSGSVEFLLLTPLPLISPVMENGEKKARVECLVRASRRPRPGDWVYFAENVRFRLVQDLDQGRAKGDLFWTGDLGHFFVRYGHVPLPPYIKRQDEPQDVNRYQTVYAHPDKQGSVAAPTAGMHFTPQLCQRLEDLGCMWAEVCLYVGYGTFSPVKSADIRQHVMHPEYIEVGSQAAESIRAARAQGRKVVAVGTTTVRTLESVCRMKGRVEPFTGWSDLYIYPGFKFEAVDQLITNFHLPKSSLLIMVSAFAGRRKILHSYQYAREKGFRFFSYGDAMFIK
ncbi:tRNA preQ1(34) S-adenosylmethionine ribosyltransferase-isomerase QueA [Desulfonatronospira sp. MSAO_Bac3]|uniref:tRNA preQ1(34) S-adenosylmethionine ribosyltransferase-isomerase QueA n=1 Tax=Desulfonatronospira sp. MSAO_Bac3 TaxID=2293857 RepID=UPI000FEF94ED|nr:tRNA preQ1(34) S-adenosylmethionine ribosyltransferase-isomerase QueA [Desulfonatronospira sp. MSAO_Bac3]RQD76463.1 MAG: tRNA preQ1(34) S-adenosylmethionine ribosyltransferase-isomerase QueA [Desulfonatronospira sp. MSAO_Bac3]